jgi:hypothetical protein
VILGIVGSEAKKFTPVTEEQARRLIRGAIKSLKATAVCSGECPLGGIDIYAKEEAIALLGEAGYIGCPPTHHRWSGKGGYQDRNIKIAVTSDPVICIVPRVLPDGYDGMRFPAGCYHCGTPAEHHVKSGGCWTTKHARSLGKAGYTIVI